MVTTAGACNRGDADAEEPRRVTACGVLTDDDVSAALGAPVGPPDATIDEGADALAGRSGCAWSTTDNAKAVLVELISMPDMSTTVRRTGFSARARFAAVRDRHAEAIAVEGWDGNALWVDEAATLHVLASDDFYVTFEVAIPDPATAEDTAVELAARAMGHLGD